jgi:hypothetical protein
MKKFAVGIGATLVCLAAHAAKIEPFAYTEGENGTTLFYRESCPVANMGDWKLAMFVGSNMTWKGCWIKHKEDGYLDPVIRFCAITKDDKGQNTLGGVCMLGDPNKVYKGNPIPERAF